MSDDQFTKLFNYMSQRFDELDTKLATKADRDQVERIQQLLDAIMGRLDHDDTERLAMSSHLDRHQQWITQLSDSTNTKLVPEP